MSDRSPAIPGCPVCGATNAVSLGIVTAGSPRRALGDQPRSNLDVRRIVERKYGCRSCGEIFSTAHRSAGGR